MAIVFCETDGSSKGKKFDLEAVWKAQELEDSLAEFFERLMRLMNQLIKQYSLSDDLGEYSKKPELWDAIRQSSEVKTFVIAKENQAVLERFSQKVSK